MADRRGNSKKSKFSQTSVAKKALLTSSASRRFKAEGDPEEEDLKHDINAGPPEQFEDWVSRQQRELGGVEPLESARDVSSVLSDEEKYRQRLLLINVPEAHRAEVLRRDREAQRRVLLRQRQAEEGAPPREAGQLSPYSLEDAQAKRTHHILSGAINQGPDNRYVTRGGQTYQSLGEGRQTLPIDEQLVRAEEDREAGTLTPHPPLEEIFPVDQVVWTGQDRAKAQELLQRREQLRALERRIKESQIKALREQRFVKDPKTGKTRIEGGLVEVRRRVQKERQQVEESLSKLRPNAVTDRRTRRPEETEALARKSVEDALTVPDPLEKPRSGFAGIPQAETGEFNKPLKKRPATDEQVEAYVKATVDSYHAPTHAQRVAAARRAQNLAGQISQQVQTTVERRSTTARHREIRQDLQSRGILRSPSAPKVKAREIPPVPEHLTDLSQEEWNTVYTRALEGGESLDHILAPRRFADEHMARMPTMIPRRDLRKTVPFNDPRLNKITTEDLYRAYGHEETAPRLKWEKDRLKAKFSGSEFTTPRPPAFSSIKQQAGFIAGQQKARQKGLIKGTTSLGVTPQTSVVPYDSRQGYKAAVATTPNWTYEYRLRNPKAETDEALSRQAHLEFLQSQPKTKEILRSIERQKRRVDELRSPVIRTVPPEDTRTRFHQGRRNRFGELYTDEFDDMVAPTTIKRRQSSSLAFQFGERIPKTGRERNPDGIDELRYISAPGAKGEVRTVKDRENQKTVTEVRDTGGRWHSVPRSEFNETNEDFRREVSVPRQIQYKFMDPKDLELSSTRERDIARIRVPKIGPRDETLLHLQFTEDPTSRLNQLGKPLRVHAEAQRLEAAQKLAKPTSNLNPELQARYEGHLKQKYGIKDRSEAQQIVAAATAAGFYASRARFTKGHLPNAANKAISLIPGSNKYNVAFAVNEAYVRPGLEKVVEAKHMIQHPLQSPTSGVMGIDFSSIKYRQELINKEKMAERAITRDVERTERVARTTKFVRKHRDQRGPVGAFTRWRMGALAKSPDYRIENKNGILHKTLAELGEARDDGVYRYHRQKTNQEEVINLGDNPRINDLYKRTAIARNQIRPSSEFSIKSPKGPSFVSRGLSHAGTERNLLIGGAVVGTAVGAGYLYHRHQESKKPENERVAFYNKVLPPAFHGPPIPRVGITRTVKFGDHGIPKELGLAKKELPVAFGVSADRRRVALRPADRGYAPNLPLIGHPSLRGTPGGSVRKGLSYYPTTRTGVGDIGKRTAIRRRTHDVSIAGRKLPGALNIGRTKAIETRGSNPRRMLAPERENLIWAFSDRPQEEQNHVKAFYRGAGGSGYDLLETWDDPEAVARIRRQKGRESATYRQFARSAVRERQRVTSAAR